MLVTLGPQGAIYKKNIGDCVHVPSPQVKCVDTTGAGDAFIGALAYVLATKKGATVEEAMKVACKAASDSVTKPGTQISFPTSDILK